VRRSAGRIRTASVGLALAAGVVLAGATPAAAQPTQTGVGIQAWNGYCSPIEVRLASVWAWCDGTGPQSYRTWVRCTFGDTYYGTVHWYGDRRGSTAVCARGATEAYGISHNV
jgi:hypothetical protein